MSFENRGGAPVVRRISVDTSGTEGGYHLPAVTKFLQLSNEGANIVRVYFSAVDFADDVNYFELDASTGFYEGPAETNNIWLKGSGGSSTIVMIAYTRRG